MGLLKKPKRSRYVYITKSGDEFTQIASQDEMEPPAFEQLETHAITDSEVLFSVASSAVLINSNIEMRFTGRPDGGVHWLLFYPEHTVSVDIENSLRLMYTPEGVKLLRCGVLRKSAAPGEIVYPYWRRIPEPELVEWLKQFESE
jgi:hypothetical protein